MLKKRTFVSVAVSAIVLAIMVLSNTPRLNARVAPVAEPVDVVTGATPVTKKDTVKTKKKRPAKNKKSRKSSSKKLNVSES